MQLHSELTVYGVTGLSIGDASIMPIVPGMRFEEYGKAPFLMFACSAAHTCATVYAIAEKVRSRVSLFGDKMLINRTRQPILSKVRRGWCVSGLEY